MEIKVLVCDNCKSTENVKHSYFGILSLDLWSKCEKNKEGWKKEVQELQNEYDKKFNDITSKYFKNLKDLRK